MEKKRGSFMEEVAETFQTQEVQETSAVKKERNSSFELMRIIGIILILLSHITPYYDSSLTSYINLGLSYSFGYIWILQFFRILGQVGNCLFLLPMGYFMIESKIKPKKVFLLVGETLFYSWIMLIIFLIFDRDVLTINEIIQQIFPITFQTNWFVTCYLLVYLISPLLNAALKHTKKETLGLLLCFFFIIYSIICILSSTTSLSLYYYNHFTGTIFVYLIGGYIRLYNPKFINSKKACVITLCASLAIILIFIVAVNLVGLRVPIISNRVLAFNYFVSFPVLLSGLSIFGLFKSTNLKTNKFINRIASCSLGVYLITNNYFIRQYGNPLLFQLIYDSLGYGWSLIPIILGIVVVYFICAVIIDLLRKISLEKLYSKLLDKLMPTFNRFGLWVKNLCSKLLS